MDAARLACCAGALAATVFGAQPSMPSREALKAFAEGQGVPWA
jgi:sugar/nucleoside kinase (ribokinase family)